MEIQESSLPGFYCSRILGVAPYLIRRNTKHRVDEIKRSPWLCAYSICFLIATGELVILMIVNIQTTMSNTHLKGNRNLIKLK